MTLIEKIKDLTWADNINTQKEILLEILERIEALEEA